MSGGTPIIYIPGIMGSQLYLPEDGRKIWFSPAAFLTDTERLDISSPLSVKNNGINLQTRKTLQREHGVLKTDIILIEWLCMTFPETPVYFFSYDFRKSVIDAAVELKQQIDTLILEGAEKVNIVCHSMGGLVTSAYVTEFGCDLLNKIMMIGVPFEGSYEVLRIYLTGDLLEIPNLIVETVGLTREMMAGYPGLAELIPTKRLLSACPIQSGGIPLAENIQEAFIRSLIPDTYDSAREVQSRIRRGMELLREKPDCWFGVGVGKTTLQSISIPDNGTAPVRIESTEGDSLVLTASAMMGGDLENIGTDAKGNVRVRKFPVRHTNLLHYPETLKWIAECLSE